MTLDKSAFEQHLAKLKIEYAAQLPQKLESIAHDWNELARQWKHDTIILLHRNVHSLIGTSGTFGFTDLSKSARDLESLLKPLIEHTNTDYQVNAELSNHVHADIDKLFVLLKQLQNTDSSEQDKDKIEKLATKLSAQKKLKITEANPVIYYVDDEVATSHALIQQLASYGFTASHFQTLEELFDAVDKKNPSLVMLSLIMPDVEETKIFDCTRTLSAKGIKVFILSGKDNFERRLEAVRAGSHAYMVKPADVPSLVGLIRSNLNLGSDKPAHILIVDDQESAASFYCNILSMAGMYVTVETDPYKTLQHLQHNAPDLLLLDLNMPGVSGDELAAVIRQQEQYQSIPILFLSGTAKPELKTSLLEIGSDDLLSKGMDPEELVRQVRSRVDRAKTLTSMMFQDSLTGLLNHAQIQLAAERIFNLCRRQQTTSCIAMIDIDKFKAVNDTYGHLTGDRVIKALAQLLEQRLRLTDYIGRFGGEEFMLVLPDININDAGNLINNLRKAFAAMEFQNEDIKFTVSFSAGISENTHVNTFMEQIKCADEALYRAKSHGRNIVCTNLIGEK